MFIGIIIVPINLILGENMKNSTIFDNAGKLINPARVFKKGAWELQIHYICKETRSEGLHGVLLKDNEVVAHEENSKDIDTELGIMKYYGRFEDRKANWDISGWCYSEQEKIPRPSQKKKWWQFWK